MHKLGLFMLLALVLAAPGCRTASPNPPPPPPQTYPEGFNIYGAGG